MKRFHPLCHITQVYRLSYYFVLASIDHWNASIPLVPQQVAIKIISKRDAPAEYISKFLPREVDAMNMIHKHANLVNL